MTTSTAKRSDQDLQTAVQAELEWTPDVDAPGIGVSVEDGAVTLSGEVDDHFVRTPAGMFPRRSPNSSPSRGRRRWR